MNDEQLYTYKTVLCKRFPLGICPNGNMCRYAHSREETRRNLHNSWYYGVRCKNAPHCHNIACQYSHNDLEIIYHPDNYKTRLCNYFAEGGCAKAIVCSFAHGEAELREKKYKTDATNVANALAQNMAHGIMNNANGTGNANPANGNMLMADDGSMLMINGQGAASGTISSNSNLMRFQRKNNAAPGQTNNQGAANGNSQNLYGQDNDDPYNSYNLDDQHDHDVGQGQDQQGQGAQQNANNTNNNTANSHDNNQHESTLNDMNDSLDMQHMRHIQDLSALSIENNPQHFNTNNQQDPNNPHAHPNPNNTSANPLTHNHESSDSLKIRILDLVDQIANSTLRAARISSNNSLLAEADEAHAEAYTLEMLDKMEQAHTNEIIKIRKMRIMLDASQQ